MHPHTPEDGLALYGKGTPTREALERIADRWTILIVRALEDGPTRFSTLKRDLDIAGQVLTRQLRDLERDGIIMRRIYAEVPVRVEYELTEFGGTLCPIVHQVRVWAESWAESIQRSRAAYDERNG